MSKAASSKAASSKAASVQRLNEGDQAPDFALQGDDGKTYRLSDLRGKYSIIFFYPKDNTPGCTREAQAFRDALPLLAKKNARVFGISRDSLTSHQKFRANHQLNFPLLTDPEATLMTACDAFGEKVMYGKKMVGVKRTTVVIDPNGQVSRVFRSVKVDGHVDAVLAALP